jgi:hypothetical protein
MNNTPLKVLELIGVDIIKMSVELCSSLGNIGVANTAELLEPAFRNLIIVDEIFGPPGLSKSESDGKVQVQVFVAMFRSGMYAGSDRSLTPFRIYLKGSEEWRKDLLALARYTRSHDKNGRNFEQKLEVYPHLSKEMIKKIRRRVVDRVHKMPTSELLLTAATTKVSGLPQPA